MSLYQNKTQIIHPQRRINTGRRDPKTSKNPGPAISTGRALVFAVRIFIFHVFRKFVHIISCWTRLFEQWLEKSIRYMAVGTLKYPTARRRFCGVPFCQWKNRCHHSFAQHSHVRNTYIIYKIHKATELTAISPSGRTEEKKHIYICRLLVVAWTPEPGAAKHKLFTRRNSYSFWPFWAQPHSVVGYSFYFLLLQTAPPPHQGCFEWLENGRNYLKMRVSKQSPFPVNVYISVKLMWNRANGTPAH